MVTNSELKRNAKRQLGGRIFGSRWMNMLVVCLIPAVISGVMTLIGVGGLSFLVSYPLSFGLARVCTRCVEGKKWAIDNLFDGFKGKYGRTVGIGILQAIYLFFWTLLLIIPGLVKTYSYAMAYYIAQDEPNDYTANDCITKSREMMDGHKWQLFCLDLSFIGWYILGALCFGIGVLFVIPYHEMARANFYEALKAGALYNAQSEGVKTEGEDASSYDAFFAESGSTGGTGSDNN